MGAFGQALAQTIGQAGNDVATARMGNQDRALQIQLQKMQLAQIQQAIADAQQRSRLALAPQTQLVPTPQGGTAAVSIPAMGGPATSQTVVPGATAPQSLSDSAIETAARNLPSWVPRDNFISAVKGYRDLGHYDQALALMGKDTGFKPQVREAIEPDPQSATGYSKVAYDPVTGQEMSRQPGVQPPASAIGTSRDTTDPVSGLTTHSTTRKILPSSGGGAGVGARPSGIPSTAAPQQSLPAAAGISPARPSQAASRLGTIQQEAKDWSERGIKPSGGAKEEAVVRRWMVAQNPPLTPSLPGTGELTLQAQQVLTRSQPVLDQIGRIRKDIEDLGLKDNNTPAWVPGSPLFLSWAQYKAGIDSPQGTLGKDIADLSLGSLVEATSALNAQGGGSRALPALMIALQHTPNPQTDSPRLILTKLANIQQRLEDVTREVKTEGTKHYRPEAGGDPAPNNNSGYEHVATGPGGQIGWRNGKWWYTATGKEFKQ